MITLITGSMFTGKTTWLLEHKEKYHKKDGILYRPKIDTRELKTHKGKSYRAKTVESIADLGEAYSDKIKAVYFDEVQFFENTIGTDLFIEQLELISQIKPVFCAGLNYDFKKRLFPLTKKISQIANETKVLKTYCLICGKLDYTYSHRKTNDSDLIVLGGDNIYEPRCFNC